MFVPSSGHLIESDQRARAAEAKADISGQKEAAKAAALQQKNIVASQKMDATAKARLEALDLFSIRSEV